MSRYTKFIKASSAACLIAATAWAGSELLRPAYSGNVGIEYGSADSLLRRDGIDFHIWYPARAGGRAVTVGGNGVFHGTDAGRGAPPKEGAHPVIFISHGAGGNAGQFGWIASALAEQGYVVVLPNHPGSTSDNASAPEALRIWERPQDVSAVLDGLQSDPDRYPFMDLSRVGVLGFSAGGYTALALAGARVDPGRLSAFCDEGGRGMSDCDFFARAGIDLHAVDFTEAAQDLHDPRIDFAVVIDPGIVETLTHASLAAIDMPMLVVNLGDEHLVPPPVHARALSETVPGASFRIVPDATHFSFLAECKPRGAEILINEGEADPLCHDAGGRPRSESHAELTKVILGFLNGLPR